MGRVIARVISGLLFLGSVGDIAGIAGIGGIGTALAQGGGAEPLSVRVVPWGPSPAVVEAARRGLLANPSVRKVLGNAETRLLSLSIVDAPPSNSALSSPPDRFRAEIFDYTHNRAYLAEGSLGNPADLRVSPTAIQPEPDDKELEKAIAIAAADPQLGPALRKGQLAPYAPMPPLVDGGVPAGTVDRTVAVGLAARDATVSHEIVGVDMIHRKVVRYRSRAPQAARATAASCGVADAGQPTTSRGTAGQAMITISKGSTPIWSFVAIRPSASSGLRASGVELRDVYYRGKKVLARAHAPILNVHYDGDACGPYRDWQWEEGNFVARGFDILPGVRGLTAPPETILENSSDNGNFRGLAYYVDEDSVTLVSEMEAGWYRYVSRWTFDADGTLHPRFGFDGVEDSCICVLHHHNVYWRFDFDVVTPENNQIFTVDNGTPVAQTAEVRQLRAPGRTWLVRNTQSGEAYSIVPGPFDGTADSYAKGDVWLLLAKSGTELDDGVNCTQCGSTAVQLDRFVEPEPLSAASNVVVWYAGHFDHDVNAPVEHNLLGPDLVPVGW